MAEARVACGRLLDFGTRPPRAEKHSAPADVGLGNAPDAFRGIVRRRAVGVARSTRCAAARARSVESIRVRRVRGRGTLDERRRRRLAPAPAR